jgi:hypothetical protein
MFIIKAVSFQLSAFSSNFFTTFSAIPQAVHSKGNKEDARVAKKVWLKADR